MDRLLVQGIVQLQTCPYNLDPAWSTSIRDAYLDLMKQLVSTYPRSNDS